METEKTAAGKLNPFALPPETNARFILLVLSAPALAFGVSQLLEYLFVPNANNPFTGIQAPQAGLPSDVYFQEAAKYGFQLMQATISSLILPLLLIGIIFITATILYRDHPRRIRKQKDAVPFEPRTDLTFDIELSTLTAQAGLVQVPEVLMGRKLNAQDGQAFGVGRHKSLYLDAGLRLLLRKSVESFRAILRHELAHIVNRDIGRTYLAQSLWSAVVIVTILPLIGSALYLTFTSTYTRLADGVSSADMHEILFVKLPTLAVLLLQSAGLVLLILLVRAGLLRTREVYADWRAALWGSGDRLASIFETQMRNRKLTGLALFRLHPTSAERLDTLREPLRLFQVHFDVPFLTGVFTGLILNGFIPLSISLILSVMPGLFAFTSALIDLAYQAHNGSVLSLLPFFYLLDALCWGITWSVGLLPFLIQAPLVASTIGLQVQRQTLSDLAAGEGGFLSYIWLLIPALWMGLGLFLGILLSPIDVLSPRTIAGIVLGLLFVIAFAFFAWLILIYTRFFSLRLLGSHTKPSPPQGKYRLLTAIVSILIILVEAPLIVGYMMFLNLPTLGFLGDFLLLIGISLGILCLYGLTFLVSWIIYGIYRKARPIRCCSCGQVISLDTAVGRKCARCGEAMTPWLFVDV